MKMVKIAPNPSSKFNSWNWSFIDYHIFSKITQKLQSRARNNKRFFSKSWSKNKCFTE